MVNYWELLNEGLFLLVTALVGLMVWYLKAVLNQKLNTEQLGMVKLIADMAVKAAEQYGGEAADKKRQSVKSAGEWLLAKGIQIDLNQLDVAIEAAVMESFNMPTNSGPLPSGVANGTRPYETRAVAD